MAANAKMLKVSPRGFANEVFYFRVPAADVAAADAEFAGYADDVARGGFAEWTNDLRATAPGVAVDWADRAYVLS